jgi:hypothetical protein
MLRQPLDLLGIENGIALEERNLPLDVLAGVVAFEALDAVGVDDRRAGFAFTDGGFVFKRLFEGHPVRRKVTALYG